MLALAGGIVAIEWYRMVWSELLFNPLVRFCPGFVYFKVYVKPNKLLLFAPFLSAKYAIGFFIGSRTAKIYWFCQKPWVDALLCSLPIHKGERRGRTIWVVCVLCNTPEMKEAPPRDGPCWLLVPSKKNFAIANQQPGDRLDNMYPGSHVGWRLLSSSEKACFLAGMLKHCLQDLESLNQIKYAYKYIWLFWFTYIWLLYLQKRTIITARELAFLGSWQLLYCICD